jgi:hypothetical protein
MLWQILSIMLASPSFSLCILHRILTVSYSTPLVVLSSNGCYEFVA